MPSDVDDAFLVRRAQDGHLDAFTELVTRHGSMTYRVALRMLGNPHDAEDVAQESLIVAWQQLSQFRGASTFSTWLYRIVTRRALNRVTRAKPTSPLDLLGEPADDGDGPYRSVERDLTVDAVTNAVTALPPAQRVAVVLHHFEGLSVTQVAEITGSSEASVRSHLFRGRRTLTATLQDWR